MRYRKFMAGLMFIEAWVILLLCKIAINLLPFKVIAYRLGRLNVDTPRFDISNARVYEVGRSIQRAKGWSIHRSNCFDQALTAATMLRWRKLPYTLYLGVDKTASEMKAHAWLRSGNRILTGKDTISQYAVIASFSFSSDLFKKDLNR